MDTNRTSRQILLGSVLTLVMAAFSPVFAQNAPQDPPAQQDQSQETPKHERAMSNLNLTDDQKAQIKKIHADTKTAVDAVNADSSLSADQKHAKIHTLHKAARKQVASLLTPEQRKQMRANMHEQRQQQTSPQPQAAPAPQQ